jgi:pimeloyl-ACP methyl ester carboxylesterase
MYALSTPELEELLDGLVLLDSAPNADWQSSFADLMKKPPIPELQALHAEYRKTPSNETLKKMTIASAPYLFTEEGLKKGIELLETLPYNHQSCLWSEEHFDQTYQAKWIPKRIPTLILSGEQDHITPIKLFVEAEQFHRGNIRIKSIKNSGHYPWIENPDDVAAAFKEFSSFLNEESPRSN